MREKAGSVEQVIVLSFWRSCSEYVRSVAESDFVRNVAGTLTTRVLLLGIGFVTSVLVAQFSGLRGEALMRSL